MTRTSGPRTAIVHDYLTQRGGAERVVLAMAHAFPDAPLYTSLYHPDGTFPEFADLDVRPGLLNRAGVIRRHHRLALPILAPAFSHRVIDADVVLCSSSGWAHGVQTTGRKVVYCLTPAHWLYQTDQYCGPNRLYQMAARTLGPWLRDWDRRAARSADRYIVTNSVMRDRVRMIYGIDADVLPPPVTTNHQGPIEPVDGVEPGFVLCVGRLVAQKNVAQIVRAFDGLPDHRLVIAGTGPDMTRVRALAGSGVTFVGSVDDARLRWLYRESVALVAASYEDFGLTPLEAGAFGKPTAALRFGGFLDTIQEGQTGILFDGIAPVTIAEAVEKVTTASWDPDVIAEHARSFSMDGFVERLRTVVEEEASA